MNAMDRLNVMDHMVSNLVDTYNGWRKAGLSHEEAYKQTVCDSLAGWSAKEQFAAIVNKTHNPSAYDVVDVHVHDFTSDADDLRRCKCGKAAL